MDLILYTSSVAGKLSNVSFNEKNLLNLQPTENIVGIRSNYLQNIKPAFNSQITFLISFQNKIYNVKLFRNGAFLLTGYKFSEDNILFDILNILIDYIKKNIIKDTDIELVKYQRVLANYKMDLKRNINLQKLYDIVNEKRNEYNVKFIEYVEDKGGKIRIKFNTTDICQTTIKVFYSGKINIDGKHDIETVISYKNWLLDIINSM